MPAADGSAHPTGGAKANNHWFVRVWLGKMTKDPAVLYGILSFCKLSMHNIFLVHFCVVFLKFHKIDKSWFYWGQLIFMVWNALNDPLFGWIQDRHNLGDNNNNNNNNNNNPNQHHKSRVDPSTMERRMVILSRAGVLLAVCFVLLWVKVSYPGIMFVVGLCVYDTFLTLVDLSLHSTLVEFSVTSRDRARFSWYASTFSMAASCAVGASHLLFPGNPGHSSSSESPKVSGSLQGDLAVFRWFCVGVGLVCGLGFYFSTRALRRLIPKSPNTNHSLKEGTLVNGTPASEVPPASKGGGDAGGGLRVFLGEIGTNPNFWWLSIVSMIQCFHCHFNSSMFPVFITVLLGSINKFWSSVLIFVSFFIPHVNNMILVQWVPRYGLHFIISALLLLKLGSAMLMLKAGDSVEIATALFLALNRISTEGVCKLLDLSLSDLADEDYVINKRRHPLPALIFGTFALLGRLGQSLAPVFGFWLIASYSGASSTAGDSPGSSGSSTEAEIPGFAEDSLEGFSRDLHVDTNPKLREVAFAMLVWTPLVLALVQSIAWARVTLRGRYLQNIKQAVLSKV